MDSVIIVAIISAVSGVLGAFIAGMWQRRKSNAEAHSTEAETNEQIRETVMQLIEPLNKRVKDQEAEITALRLEVAALRGENADLKCWADALVRQVRTLGVEPVAVPSPTRPRKQKP